MFRGVVSHDELWPLHGVVCTPGIGSMMNKRRRWVEWAEKSTERGIAEQEEEDSGEREGG